MSDRTETTTPEPESADLGRYLEDTITIDWQTPIVMEQGRALTGGCPTAADRLSAIFEFVRTGIRHSLDHEGAVATCSASQVLRERTGLSFAKSHLLAALLRFWGVPAGFCYLRRQRSDGSGHFVLHGFNAVFWTPNERWLLLDASGAIDGETTRVRFEPPWSLAYVPDSSKHEGFLPAIRRRPEKRIIDLLERAPDFETIRRNLPDGF